MSSRRDIELELNDHILETVDELRAQGLTPPEAERQARARFGSPEKIASEIAELDRQRAWWTPHVSAALGATIAIVVSLGYWLRQYPLNSVLLQPIGLSLLYLGIFSAVTLVVKWVSEYFGLRSRHAVWLILLFSLLVNFSVTTVYDLDKVFIPLHALITAVAVAGLVVWRWSSMSVLAKRSILFGFAIVATWSAFHNQPMLAWLQTPPCIYITPDQVPAEQLARCQHWSWLTSGLWPVYLTIVLGIIVGANFLRHYWHNAASRRLRKIGMTLAFVAIPILPITMHDINNYGQVDIVSWKPAIYQAYQDILGRRPQQKDIDFYGYTRSYQVMPKVKAVLYASRERRLKIDLLHREILQRPASAAEIQFFVDGRQTIQEIRDYLTPR